MHRGLAGPVALVVLALAVAGCADDGPAAPPGPEPTAEPDRPYAVPAANGTAGAPGSPVADGADGAHAPAGTGFLVIEPGPACAVFCEPVVAVGLDGRVFVKANTYARSTPDGGWEEFLPPALPLSLPVSSFQTDRHIQVAPDGTLWFSSLIASFQQGFFFLLGVQVAHSPDDGTTWTSSFLPVDGRAPAGSLGADRQWLAIAPEGRVYVSFQQNPAVVPPFGVPVPLPVPVSTGSPNTANVWVAYSDDRGASWTDFAPADELDPLADQATGQPIVLADGTLVVPFQRSPIDDALAFDGFVLGIADDGEEFRQVEVSPGGAFFPAILEVPGGFVAAQMDSTLTLTYAASASLDEWPAFQALGDEGEMLSSPWLGLRPDGRWDLVWLERTAGSEDLFDILHSANGGPPATLVTGLLGQPNLRANTDFAHATYLDGRLLVVTGDAERGPALLLLEPDAQGAGADRTTAGPA